MNAAAYSISGTNQKLYLRLKTSLQLNLRRQIFLAVCDDLELRSHLVSQLQTAFGFPRFVSLNLNLSDPNPMVQVAQWLSQREKVAEADRSFGFQVLGVEHLTRQPASVQKRFLTHLQAIEYYLPVMDYTMLLWLPRPWLRSLQQSAPAFWDWHTALFEFEGDPAPLRNPNSVRLQNDRVPSRAIAQAHQPSISNQKHFSPDKSLNPVPIVPAAQIAIKPVENPQTSGSLTQAEEESIWDMLTYDLAQLDREPKSNSATYQHHKPITPPKNSPQTPQPPTPNPKSQKIRAAIAQESTLHHQTAHHQTALRSLQQIDRLIEQHAPQTTIATAYLNLGKLYRHQLEQGNFSPETLDIAIAVQETTLEWLQNHTPAWIDGINDLGNLYWMQSRTLGAVEQQLVSLQKAIQAYRLVLHTISPEAAPQTYAMIQNNLGSAYGDLAQYQEPATNLLNSVEAYELALRYRDPNEAAARYAATQNNLGTACWNLAQHQQPIARLNQAIAAYQVALQHYTPTCEPMHYAMIQNNLGTAYWNLAQHLKPSSTPTSTQTALSPNKLLHCAIAAYEAALIYRTLEAAPTSFAATQNNLGTAHWNLANLSTTPHLERSQHLKQAIAAYESAIAAVEILSAQTESPPTLTFDIFATSNNLGLSYYQLACDRPPSLSSHQRQTFLESALNQHLQALQAWEPSPDFYQATLSYIIQTVRAFYSEFGIQGQNLALSKLPANLLPEIMRKL
jgi:tetratricopeptide (TPR) repeat protein